MRWFKRKTTNDHIEVFTGYVQFINNKTHKVESGIIFGSPFREAGFSLMGTFPLMYHIRQGDQITDVPHHALERVK